MNAILDKEKLKQIIQKRLLNVPDELKKHFPLVLSNPKVSWIVLSPPNYFMLVFVDEYGIKRALELKGKNYNPFPGLIKDNPAMAAAFRLNQSKNVFMAGCNVENLFSFDLGQDSSVIISDHHQSINIIELGKYEYKIELAYIISFGDEFNNSNILEILEELITYSIKQWRPKIGK